MDEPTNQMAITAVLVVDAPIDHDRLRRLLERRLLIHDRFHECVQEVRGSAGRPRWVEAGGMDLERHLAVMKLQEPAGRDQLEALVGREMSAPLDPTRPLWRLVHVPDFAGGAALVARVHHCIADGMALIRLLLELDDEGNRDVGSYWGPPAVSRDGRDPRTRGLLPPSLGLGVRAAGSLAHLAGMRPDPRSALRGSLGAEKRAAWSGALELPGLRAAARRIGATLNDVVVATVAGGVGRFLDEHGERPGRPLRAVIPVNLRGVDEQATLGNRFGLVFAPLPIGIGDPVGRVRAVRQAMDRLKRSPEAGVVFGLLDFFGCTPRRALDAAVSFLGTKASLVLTNVPGPRQRIRFCGSQLVELIAWVPQSGRLGLGVSALTYGDDLRFGIAADARLLPDPRRLVRACEAAACGLLDSVPAARGRAR